MKDKIVGLLLPYFDIFHAGKIADEIINQYKTTGKSNFIVNVGFYSELEITLTSNI